MLSAQTLRPKHHAYILSSLIKLSLHYSISVYFSYIESRIKLALNSYWSQYISNLFNTLIFEIIKMSDYNEWMPSSKGNRHGTTKGTGGRKQRGGHRGGHKDPSYETYYSKPFYNQKEEQKHFPESDQT